MSNYPNMTYDCSMQNFFKKSEAFGNFGENSGNERIIMRNAKKSLLKENFDKIISKFFLTLEDDREKVC